MTAKEKTLPALFVLEPDTREAYNVLRFCSVACRDAVPSETIAREFGTDPYVPGEDDIWEEGEVCNTCHLPLGL